MKLRKLVVAVLCLAAFVVPCGLAETGPKAAGWDDAVGTDTVWTDTEVQWAIELGCKRGRGLQGKNVEHYRGIANKHDMIGPLWLEKAGDRRARGVILPTALRLYLYGRSQGCRRLDLADARTLAGPETWVVVWRAETPHRPFTRATSSDQKVLRPTEIRLRHQDAWHEPASTRNRDRWIQTWYGEDWDEKESLVAAFPSLPHQGVLHVDYDLSEDGRSYLKDSAIFSLSLLPEEWWAAAHNLTLDRMEGDD